MMLAYRLVRLIETHADRLASDLLQKVQNSPELPSYRNVPLNELRGRVYDIYRHLGEWLMGKDESELRHRYAAVGLRRASQQVPLSELILAIVLTKENLWDYLKTEALIDRPIEVFGELELLQMLERFFDRAIYYAAMAYEQAEVAGQKAG